MTAVYNVLFLCTGNSARSILGEAVLNRIGEGRFRAYSAGSQPKGDVHPMTIGVLESFGYPTEGLRAKNWNELPVRMRRSSISSSRCATTLQAKAARSGQESHSPPIGVSKTLLRSKVTDSERRSSTHLAI